MTLRVWTGLDPQYAEQIAKTRALEDVRLLVGTELPESAALMAGLSEAVGAASTIIPPGRIVYAPAYPADATAAFQEALDTGEPLLIPAGSYAVNNLTQDTNGQVLYALGQVLLLKNANGDLFTSTGNNVHIYGVSFYGDASTPVYTGDNVVASGAGFKLIHCASQWAYGRAVKMTGDHAEIDGTCGLYQTADQTATGYDIEVGVSGTATLYHKIRGVYSSQATGGIKMIDVGGHRITDCQIGKVTIIAGTTPAGVNGGTMVGNRILGDVTVELANSVWSANQFGGSVDFTITGGSNHMLDISNVWGTGSTLTNNGNGNSVLMRQVGTSTAPTIRYGDDTNFVDVTYTGSGTDTVSIAGGITVGGLTLTGASTTGSAGLRVPHGVAPTSPVNGDLWSTSSAFLIRINGASKTIVLAGENVTLGEVTGTLYKVGANQVVGAQGAAVADDSDDESAAYTGQDNAQGGAVYAKVADLNALRVAYEDLRGKFNSLLARARAHGLIAT